MRRSLARLPARPIAIFVVAKVSLGLCVQYKSAIPLLPRSTPERSGRLGLFCSAVCRSEARRNGRCIFSIDHLQLVAKSRSAPKVAAATSTTELDTFHALALRSGNYETLVLAAQLISSAIVESLQNTGGRIDAMSVEHWLSSQIEV